MHGGRHWDEKAISVISGFKLNLGLGGKNTQNCTKKKCLNDLDNHDGVVTHIEPDIWSAKSSGPEEALL